MMAYHVKNCLILILSMEVSVLESRPIPVSLPGGPIYPMQAYGAPYYYPFGMYPTNQQPYIWPRYTMTPSNPKQFIPTTGVVGAAQNLAAALFNFADAENVGLFGMPSYNTNPRMTM